MKVLLHSVNISFYCLNFYLLKIVTFSVDFYKSRLQLFILLYHSELEQKDNAMNNITHQLHHTYDDKIRKQGSFTSVKWLPSHNHTTFQTKHVELKIHALNTFANV